MLADSELRRRLSDIGLSAATPNFPIRDSQIQCSSIDLRLSDVVYVPRHFRRMDLASNVSLGPQVTDAFRRRRILFPRGHLLRPGGFLLGRTYESFSVPKDLVGWLAGRSSLGRLGLSVVAPSNFINPGWRGHMPLMLINQSPFWVRVHPYLSVVQLCFFEMKGEVQRPYGTQALGSKYIDDDGGPSKFWLDRSVTLLRENLNLKSAGPEAERFLSNFAQELDEPTRRRLTKCVETYGVVEDVKAFIEEFVKKERARTELFFVGTLFVSLLSAILVSWAPAMLSAGQRLIVGGLAFAAALSVGWLCRMQFGSTYSPFELRRIAREVLREVESASNLGAANRADGDNR
jgi:deoxycytidine triphosphate deaminase